jgi:hypothetical protein
MSDFKFYAVGFLILAACVFYMAWQAVPDPGVTASKTKKPRAKPAPGPAPWDQPVAAPAVAPSASPAGTPPVFLPDPAIRPAYRPSDQPWGTSSTRYTQPTVPVSGHWRKGKWGNLYWVRSHKRRPS